VLTQPHCEALSDTELFMRCDKLALHVKFASKDELREWTTSIRDSSIDSEGNISARDHSPFRNMPKVLSTSRVEENQDD
jgi:hypothetical protein